MNLFVKKKKKTKKKKIVRRKRKSEVIVQCSAFCSTIQNEVRLIKDCSWIINGKCLNEKLNVLLHLEKDGKYEGKLFEISFNLLYLFHNAALHHMYIVCALLYNKTFLPFVSGMWNERVFLTGKLKLSLQFRAPFTMWVVWALEQRFLYGIVFWVKCKYNSMV